MAALSTDDAKGGSGLESKGGGVVPPPPRCGGLRRTPLALQTLGSNMGLVILQKRPYWKTHHLSAAAPPVLPASSAWLTVAAAPQSLLPPWGGNGCEFPVSDQL